MRTKTIVDGFKNSQKFRFILTANSGEEVGMTITVQQMTDLFSTTDARIAVWTVLEYLAYDRDLAKRQGKPVPTGLVKAAQGFRQVQIDLH